MLGGRMSKNCEIGAKLLVSQVLQESPLKDRVDEISVCRVPFSSSSEWATRPYIPIPSA
jgi:hypothetical protein